MRTQTLAFLAIGLIAAGCGHRNLVTAAHQPAAGYVVRDVTVFTAIPDQPVIQGADVHIRDGKIVQVAAERLEVRGARVLDGRGKTLMPGLVDSHVHVTGAMIIPWNLATPPTLDFHLGASLYAGITTIVDMSGWSTRRMNQLADQLEAGQRLGPHLLHVGMGFTGPGCHPIPYREFVRSLIAPPLRTFVPQLVHEVKDLQDLSALDAHLAEDAMLTKVFVDRIPPTSPIIDEAILHAIVERSHAADTAVVAHIGTSADARAVIAADGDVLVHQMYKERIAPGLAGEIAAAGVPVVPTMVVFETYHLFDNVHDYTHYSELERETTHPVKWKALQEPHPVDKPEVWDEGDEAVADGVSHLHANTAALYEAGVTLLAGSDSPNMGLTIGGSLHEELEHLVAAGLTPGEALLAATSVPATVWCDLTGRDRDFGTIEPGMRADLLLVRGDPTADITATQAIEEVFIAGQRLKRHAPKTPAT